MEKKPWGYHTIIDLHNCDHTLITDPIQIKQFSTLLVDFIDMKPYSAPFCERFGPPDLNLEGYTLIQPIETSSITAHFDEVDDRAFIDIFSCQSYNQDEAAKFCAAYFNAILSNTMFVNRQ